MIIIRKKYLQERRLILPLDLKKKQYYKWFYACEGKTNSGGFL